MESPPLQPMSGFSSFSSLNLFWLTIIAVLLVVAFHSAVYVIDKYTGGVGGQVSIDSQTGEIKPLELHTEASQ